MTRTTRAQREAIHKLFCRLIHDAGPNGLTPLPEAISSLRWRAYRLYRKRAVPTIGCDNAVVVPFAGMFVCIEQDGYAHT